MNAHRSPLRPVAALAALAALAVVALALVGCAKKITSVDPAYVMPDGRPDSLAQMIVYPDVPMEVAFFLDNAPPGADVNDTFERIEVLRPAPGAMRGTIIEGTTASAYEVLRREANGGFARLKDFTLPPVTRFLDSHWDVYSFVDPRPSGYTPPTYVGRGVVAGQITRESPLTNLGQWGQTDIPELVYDGREFYRYPPDSNITMKWTQVPGAWGYLMQVYQPTGNTEEFVMSSQVAPLVTHKVRNYFVGFVPAPADSYKIGLPGALVLTRRTMVTGVQYLVRVTAIDNQGEIIGFTYGDLGYAPYSATEYRLFRAGAVGVLPTRPTRP